MIKYYGNKTRLAKHLQGALPIDYKEYLELCAGSAAIARKLIVRSVPRTIVEKDHGQATLLMQIQKNPIVVADRLLEVGYNRDVFEAAMSMKKAHYLGVSELETAVARKVLTDMSYNAMCTSYRDIDRKAENDFVETIKAQRYRERYYRQIMPDCTEMSMELQGINIVEGDMFNYLSRLSEEELFCTIDPPYRPELRAAGKKGYDQDWDFKMHFDLMDNLHKMYMDGNLKAKVMIFGYIDLFNPTEDLYCKYLLRMGFDLYLLKDVYLPKIVKENTKSKKRNKNTECVFINYEPIGGEGIVANGRKVTFEDLYGEKQL